MADIPLRTSNERLTTQVMTALRSSALVRVGGQVVSWGMTLFVMRLLVPEDYGLVAMLTLIFLFLGLIADMGLDSTIIQSPHLSTEEFREVFGASIAIGALIAIGLFLAAPAIAAFYGEPRLVDMTRVAALGFIAVAPCPIYSGLLQREMRFQAATTIEIAAGLIGNLTTMVLAFAGMGAWALVLGTLVAGPVRAFLLFANASTFYWPTFRFSRKQRFWRFGGNVLLMRIVWYWTSQADILVAGKLLGKEALGLYSVAVHLASLPMQRASGMINGVAFAAFAKIQDDRKAVAHNTRLAVRLMAFVTFPVLWGIAAIAPELVQVVIGPAWTESILPLTLVALTIPLRMIGSVITTTIMSLGLVDTALVTTLFGALIAPPLFYFGARYGIVGLSIAWLVAAPAIFLLNLYRALPILGLSGGTIASELWRPVAISALMFVAVGGVRSAAGGLPAVGLLPVLILAGAAVYVAGMYFVNRAASMEALSLLFPARVDSLRTARHTAT